MFGSNTLEIATGLIFVYLLLSLICTAINEGIAASLSSRANHLQDWLPRLIAEDKLLTAFYAHPLIAALTPNLAAVKFPQNPPQPATSVKAEHPSYIPARTFALVLLDIVVPPKVGGGVHDITSMTAALANLPGPVAAAIRALANQGSMSVAELRQNIENWFNDSMDRLSGWYKRRTQWVLLVISLAITLAFNVDSVAITKALVADSTLRASLSEAAKSYVEHHKDEKIADTAAKISTELNSLGLPIGWSGNPKSFSPGSSSFWGWLAGLAITAIAISLGAPFWFDTLNKIMQLRSSVKPPAKPQP